MLNPGVAWDDPRIVTVRAWGSPGFNEGRPGFKVTAHKNTYFSIFIPYRHHLI